MIAAACSRYWLVVRANTKAAKQVVCCVGAIGLLAMVDVADHPAISLAFEHNMQLHAFPGRVVSCSIPAAFNIHQAMIPPDFASSYGTGSWGVPTIEYGFRICGRIGWGLKGRPFGYWRMRLIALHSSGKLPKLL